MPTFGPRSRKNRDECHEGLQRVLNEAIKHYDFSVICGHRGQGEQDEAYNRGNSTVKWPNSKHNRSPSWAFDVVPYPGGFDNPDEAFYELATHILGAASRLYVPVRWGGHWKTFKDLAHFELIDDFGLRTWTKDGE